LKILFHHRVASRDGQSVHIEELTGALAAQGHEIVMVGPSAWSQTGFGGSNALIDRIKQALPGAAFELLEIGYNVPAFIRLWRAVRRHRPDVIYERFSLLLFAGIWARRLCGVPLLLEINAPLFEERARNDGLKLAGLGRWAQRMLWNNADMALPVTEVLAGMVRDYGVPAARIAVIPNGINPARFDGAPHNAEAKRALGLDGLVLGFTGFIRGWNAVDRIVDVVAAHGERLGLRALVVGDGPAREPLLAHAAKLGVADRLAITGVVERDAVAAHVAAFDIAVLPGLTLYSSPLKLFEYMYLGRAIVAPDTPNIREILTDGEDALLFAVDQPGAMEAVLLRLCEDAELRVRLGAAARARTLTAKLTWAHNAERVAGLARHVCTK
jgi:glycosyltransferase involved in cell wall biosynthesis